MAKKPPGAQDQLELALSSALAHARFEGRSMLLVAEVADALECSPDHVEDLIDEGKLVAVNIAGGGNITARRFLRIPVSSYDLYIKGNATQG